MKPLFNEHTLAPGLRRVLGLASPVLRRWARSGYFGKGRLAPPFERVLLLSCGGVTATLWAGQVVAPLADAVGADRVWAACDAESAPIWHGWLAPERVVVLPAVTPGEVDLNWGAVWRDAARLREERFDVVFDVTGRPGSALAAFLSRPRRAYGPAPGELDGLYSARPPALPPAGHLARRPWAAVAPLLGSPAPGEPEAPRVTIEPSPPLEAVLGALGLRKDQPYAVLVPGGAPPCVRYPSTRLAPVAARIADEVGLAVIALGDGRHYRLLEAVVGQADPGAVAAGLPFPDAARLLEGARLVVGNDSSRVHLAAALGAPVVALYGPTDPQVRRPLGRRVRVLSTACPHRAGPDGDGFPRRPCPSEDCWGPLTPARILAACRLQLLA